MKINLVPILVLLACCLTVALRAEEVTRETMPTICPKLQINQTVAEDGVRGIEIKIPANELRLQRLFQTWFIISDAKGAMVLRVPMKIVDADGAKTLNVDVSPEMLKHARIALDCFHKDPKMSSIDQVTLVLPSMLEKHD